MLSIIIPLRNEAENLAEILSHFNNNLSKIDHEVILVNDFSIDDTFKKAKKSQKNMKILKLLKIKKGLGGAINVGIECCKGEKICIMMETYQMISMILKSIMISWIKKTLMLY